MWPMLLDISKDECRGILRRLELEAYAGVLNAFRAQGTLGQKKRDMLDEIRSILHINDDRHKAEIRRVTNDETLCTVAERICGGNSRLDWLSEGRRTVPLLQRGRLETAYAALADSIAREAFKQNNNIRIKGKNSYEVLQSKQELPDHAKVIMHENEQTILSVPKERSKKRRRESIDDINHEIETKPPPPAAQNFVNPRIPPVPTKPTVIPPSTSKSTPSPSVHHHEKNREYLKKKTSQLTTNAKIKQLYNSQIKLKPHSYQKYPSATSTTAKATSISVPPLHVPKIKTNRGPNPQMGNTSKGLSVRPPSQGYVRKVFDPSVNNVEIKQRLSPNEQVSNDDNTQESVSVTRTTTSGQVVQNIEKVQYVVSSFQKVLGSNQKVNKPDLPSQEIVRSVKVLPQQKPVLVTNNRIKQYTNIPNHNGKTVKLVSIAQTNKTRPMTTLVPVSNTSGKVTISNTAFKPITLQNVSGNKFTKVQMTQDGNKANVIFLQKPKLGKEVPVTLTKDGKEIKLIMPTENMKKDQNKPANVYVLQAEKNTSFTQILQASGIIPPKNEIIAESNQNQITNNRENAIGEDRQQKTLFVNTTSSQSANNINILNSTDWEEELDNASSNKYLIRNQSKVKVVGYKTNNGDQVLRIDENLQNQGSRGDTILCLNSPDTYTIIKDKEDNPTVMSDSELMHILNGTSEDNENMTSPKLEYNTELGNNVKRQDIFQKALEQANIKLGSEECLEDMENDNLNDNVYVTERLQGDSLINDHVVYEPIQKNQVIHDTSSVIVEEEEVVMENYYVEQNMVNVAVDGTHTFDIGTTDVEMSLMEVT